MDDTLPGEYAVVQAVTSASAQFTTNDVPSQTMTAFVQKNNNGNIITPTFDLADGSTYFYAEPGATADGSDTPQIPGGADVVSGSYNIAFKDYALFSDGGAWVPFKSWTWSENIAENTVNVNGVNTLVASNTAAPTVSQVGAESSYPTWTDYSKNWTSFIRTK